MERVKRPRRTRAVACDRRAGSSFFARTGGVLMAQETAKPVRRRVPSSHPHAPRRGQGRGQPSKRLRTMLSLSHLIAVSSLWILSNTLLQIPYLYVFERMQ